MTDNFFNKKDTPHGLAKRIILYRYLQAQFARALNTPREIVDFDITYLDAFSGTGYYENNEEENDVDDLDVTNEAKCPFDEYFGSPLVALEAFFKHVTEQKVFGSKKALFIFIEIDKSRYEKLQQNVRNYFMSRELSFNNNQPISDTIQCSFEVNLGQKKGNHTNIVEVNIEFHRCDFNDFDNESIRYNQPMVTFFDPFGFKDTPMEKVMIYTGKRRSIILNFMVRDINRFMRLDKNREKFNLLFGTNQWRMELPENFGDLSVVEKMENYATVYRNCFQKMYTQTTDEPIRFLKFSLRKGSRQGVEKGFIYYMLFAAVDLTAMKSVKYALHTAAQNFKLPERPETTTDELYFADFYFRPETPWCPKEAKDLKKEEANCIYQHYKGQVIKFGDLKEWVIMETPYQFHSRALQDLEKNKYLTVISTDYDRYPGVPKYERKNKAFPGNVGTYKNDQDWDDRLKNIYCNGWLLKFEEENEENANSVKRKRKREHETPSQKSWGNSDAVGISQTKRRLFRE